MYFCSNPDESITCYRCGARYNVAIGPRYSVPEVVVNGKLGHARAAEKASGGSGRDEANRESERTLKEEAAWATLPAAALTGCDMVAFGGVV